MAQTREVFFTTQLLEWNKTNKRQLPWKGEKDPYKIWLSEIILQQTRVEQGLSYYQAFVRKYPDVKALAIAPEDEVFRLWQGLGYYARCKNMLVAARQIVDQFQGRFPDTYKNILALKGIGPYTAAAIASLAFNLPHAVLDGNVFRVLARFFEIAVPIDTTAGKKKFSLLAQSLLPPNKAGIYNQALMDFGATVCKPQQPKCSDCPLRLHCGAYLKNKTVQLPVKSKKIQVRQRCLHYLIIRHKEAVYLRKRTAKDIWENLFEFVPIETNQILSWQALQQSDAFRMLLANHPFRLMGISKTYRHQLTHQTIFAQFVLLQVKYPPSTLKNFISVPLKNLHQYAFPQLIVSFLQEKTLTLTVL